MSNYAILNFDLLAAATTTEWRRLLTPKNTFTRAIHGTLVSGDTIQVQFTNEVLTSEKDILSSNAVTTNVAASPSQTATNFELSYDGGFRWVRVVKTGTAGVARVTIEA